MYQITDNCVCCHNCALECPAQAISYAGPRYAINNSKCIECGLCEKLCHTGSVIEIPSPETQAFHERIVRTCDVVVCGGGTGLIAAVRAAQLGKKVILLEKSKKLGGNTDYAHGFSPVYTKWHEKRGFSDIREQAVEVFWERSGKRLDKEVVRSAVYGCGEFFDWLCTFPGTEKAFDLQPLEETNLGGPFFGQAVIRFPQRLYDNLLCHDEAIGPGWGGTFIKYAMLNEIHKKKLWVDLCTSHTARHLLTDSSGAVTGVLANDGAGEVQINAGTVILATGGFGKSDEKLRKYYNFFDCETPIHRFSVPGDTGDAIDMLEELGVAPPLERMNVSIFGPAHHPYSYALLRIMEHPSCMSVNTNGRRWQDESKGLVGGRIDIAKQPGEIAWGIFDQSAIGRIIEDYINDPKLSEEKWQYDCWNDLEEEIKIPLPPVIKADTIENLASRIGMEPAALVETVKRYNTFCMAGRDEDFGKDSMHLRPVAESGPYYAIYGKRFSEGAFGGLRVNSECEVLREDGSPIPGLYGVGDATSAMHIRGELAVISELTWATASAYIAGKNASEYLRGGA